jgi:hypothetical protein
MTRAKLEAWVQGYLKAWKTNDPEDIRAIFTDDVRYYTQAFRKPWVGIKKIVEGWTGRVDEQGDWKFDYKWIAVEGNVGVLEGLTTYTSQETAYNNIWIVTLAEDGRCSEFREQWVQQPEEN